MSCIVEHRWGEVNGGFWCRDVAPARSDRRRGGNSRIFDQLPNCVRIVYVPTRIAALAPVELMRLKNHDKMVQFSLARRGLLHCAQPIWTCLYRGRMDAWSALPRSPRKPNRIGENGMAKNNATRNTARPCAGTHVGRYRCVPEKEGDHEHE